MTQNTFGNERNDRVLYKYWRFLKWYLRSVGFLKTRHWFAYISKCFTVQFFDKKKTSRTIRLSYQSLTCAKHIHTTKLKLNQRLYLFRPVLGQLCKIPLKTKIHVYNLLHKSARMYGTQPRGTDKKKTNTQKQHKYSNRKSQTHNLCSLHNSNHTLHTDLSLIHSQCHRNSWIAPLEIQKRPE